MKERDHELLQLALSGDLPRTAPELARALAQRPDLARRLAELEALGQGLDALADDEGRAIERARAATTEGDRQAVADALRRARSGGTAQVRGDRLLRWSVLAAIAATLFVVALTAWRLGREPSRRTFLSSTTNDELVIEAPAPGDARWDEIRWKGRELPPGWTYEVRLEGVGSGDPTEPVTLTFRTTENRWRPTDEELARLAKGSVRIALLVRDDAGGARSSVSVEVSR